MASTRRKNDRSGRPLYIEPCPGPPDGYNPPQPAPYPPPGPGVPWPSVPPHPVPSPAMTYAGHWPQSYSTTQFYRQQIPAYGPSAHVPAQHWPMHPPGGFHYPAFPYRGPSQGDYTSFQPPLIPLQFQSGPSRQFPGTNRWHDVRPENHGFATHHSEYRRGHVEYQANFDSNIPEMLLRHKHGRHVPRPSRPSPDDAPPIYDDAAAAHDQQYPQEPSRTDLPANRRSNARQATSEDAAKHKIPSGYDLQNWDPDEKPIMVFGSVFDASSLGKWIHDWTVIAHGSFATETDKSSELWSSLMRTAGKLRRSARFISQSVEQGKNAEMVQDLIESGERLMERFQKFLNACEETMYDSDEEDTGDQPEDSGMDFVYAIFSSEKHSAQTDSLMRNMRLWNRRWDENCGVLMGALEPDTEQPTDDGVDSERDSALDVNSSLRNEEYRVVEGPDGEQFRARRATMEDAKQHNIPANYNLQCWDPAERPLLLHQFVFDAMSLGKWIVDCTSYLYGGDSPLTNTAGELWGLLIHLAGKVKLSQQFLSRNRKKSKSVRGTQVIRVVTSSAQRGEHLIQELQQLLQECEQSVTETRDTNAGQLGELSETGSVSFLLSEEGCLGRTEEFMQALRLWISDWDQHVSGILRLFPPNRQSAAG